MARATQAKVSWVRSLSGAVRALNDIEKHFNSEVKRVLGPEYRGVLRDYDYQNPESRPIIMGDMRDTTYFVILKGRGNNIVAAESVLFEAELESEQEGSELEPGDEGTIEFAEKKGERAVQEYFYNQYMWAYESMDDAGYFGNMWEAAERKKARGSGYLSPGRDPTMPRGGPPVYHGPEERYGGRRPVKVKDYARRRYYIKEQGVRPQHKVWVGSEKWPSQVGMSRLRRHRKRQHPRAFRASIRKGIATRAHNRAS